MRRCCGRPCAVYLGQTDATFELALRVSSARPTGREVPALRWADVSERGGGDGLSLLNNCKYGHQAHGNTLGLTLVRALARTGCQSRRRAAPLHLLAVPPCRRSPGSGDGEPGSRPGSDRCWRSSCRRQTGSSYSRDAATRPARPGLRCTERHHLGDQAGRGTAGIRRSGDRHVLRGARQACGRRGLRPAWPIARAEETNLIEQRIADLPVGDGVATLTLAPHEIKTVRLTR